MSHDLARRLAVTAAAVACGFGTALGLGAIGTRVEESSGGALAADATLIAPAGPAFSIWSVIYLGLAGYVVWQWLPSRASDARARAIGWWAALSLLLNGAWLMVTQQGWIWPSVGVILALAVVLKVIVARLAAEPASGWVDRVLLDGTFGLYLGWVAVATCANIAAALVDTGVGATGRGAELTTVAVLLVVLGLGWWYSRSYPSALRWPVVAAMTWGVAWVCYGRLGDEPSSIVVGVGAAVVAVGLVTSAAFHTALHVAPQHGRA